MGVPYDIEGTIREHRSTRPALLVPHVPTRSWEVGPVLYAVNALLIVLLSGAVIRAHRKGGVPRGESYIRTTRVADTGLYSVVRHPQCLSAILLSWAFSCFSQFWPIVLATIAVTVTLSVDIVRADSAALEKFGAEYAEYMRCVPRANFVAGLYRRLRR